MQDLFETPEVLPVEVRQIIESFEGEAYNESRRILKLLKPLGYSFEFGLDGIPYNLHRTIPHVFNLSVSGTTQKLMETLLVESNNPK